MGLFYTASTKELLQLRNKIFLDHGLSSLQKNGFQKSPFTAWFGKSDIGYTYELCRLSVEGELEIITTQIISGDLWIQIMLNIFLPQPRLDSLDQLKGLSGLKFGIPPCSQSEMRLRMDDIKGPPVLNYDYMFRNHKIRSYQSKAGLAKRVEELGKIIESDLSNIDLFVKRWHEMNKPMLTSWEGTVVLQKS